MLLQVVWGKFWFNGPSVLGWLFWHTAGSDIKVQTALALGADFGINYRTQDFAAEVNQITQGLRRQRCV